MEIETYNKQVEEIKRIMRVYREAEQMLDKYRRLESKLQEVQIYDSLVEVSERIHVQLVGMIMAANLDEMQEDKLFNRLTEITHYPFD